jgi:hypothetical protein
VSSPRIRIVLSILISLVLALAVLPANAEAQRRGARGSGPRGRQVILVGGLGMQGPAYRAQYPWGWYGPWGQWPRGYYPRYYMPEFPGSLRLDVDQKQAEVFVDGWLAGVVDDFDGFFQSLTLRPGEYEIAIYLEGYRTERLSLLVAPGSSRRIKLQMQKLGAGESSGARPEPRRDQDPAAAPGQASAPRATQPTVAAEPQPTRFGTLSIKVMPADAEILVDDQPWAAAGGEQRLSIRLSAGVHKVEVKKAGFETYAETILIRPDATMTLNVTLKGR